ncbi:MAG: hypothetical protein HY926_07900 [Elusimicrobia bacterium]|nr:hypothetical protein [Elusimicrobiota bacterium]
MTPAAFGPQDMLKLALDIEVRGREVYERLESSARDVQVKAVWASLKAQEFEHSRAFERLLRAAQSSLPDESSSAQVSPYLRALAAGRVFEEERLSRVLAAGVRSDLEALELAIGMERDTILAYLAFKEHLLGDSGRVLERILEEERRHVVALTELCGRIADRFPESPPDLPTGL